MRHYLILDQDTVAVTVLEGVGDQWVETKVTEGAIALPEVGVALPVAAIYAKVRFGQVFLLSNRFCFGGWLVV